jgi:O6-methylguanine-DNA--protein-cysteine methyltransferase
MKSARLELWSNGKLKDEDLTDKEIRFLEKQVFRAVHRALAQNPTKITFRTHRTIQ